MWQMYLPPSLHIAYFSLDIDRLDGRGAIHFPSAHSENDEIYDVSRRLEILIRFRLFVISPFTRRME